MFYILVPLKMEPSLVVHILSRGIYSAEEPEQKLRDLDHQESDSSCGEGSQEPVGSDTK